jgi:hypothetical protein
MVSTGGGKTPIAIVIFMKNRNSWKTIIFQPVGTFSPRRIPLVNDPVRRQAIQTAESNGKKLSAFGPQFASFGVNPRSIWQRPGLAVPNRGKPFLPKKEVKEVEPMKSGCLTAWVFLGFWLFYDAGALATPELVWEPLPGSGGIALFGGWLIGLSVLMRKIWKDR